MDVGPNQKVLEWEPLVGRLTRGQASSQSTAILLAPNLLLTCAHVLVEDASLEDQKLKDKKIEEIVNSAKERATQSGQDLNGEINNIILENKGIIDRIQDQCVWVGDSCASLNPLSEKGGFLHVSLRNTQGSSSIGAERLDFAIVGLNEAEKGWSSESIRAWKNLTPFILERSPDSFTTRDKVYILGYPLYEEIVEKLPKQKIKTYHTFNPRKISHIQTFITSGETCYLGYFEQANMFHRSGHQIGVTSINEGLSGAPVFNSQGEWLGFHHGVKGKEGLAVQVSAVADYIKKNAIALPLFEPEHRFLRLLADHYQKELELSIFKPKFDKKKNTLIFPIDGIYTKLMIVGEKEKERLNAQIGKEDYDQRLETYESIFRTKRKLTLNALFDHEKIQEKKKQQRIIYGAAGVGKTTMSSMLASEAKKLWPDCSALFLIQLRNLNQERYPASKAHDVNEVIARECGFEGKEPYIDLLKGKHFRDRAILLLDGYDEFPQGVNHLRQLLSELITSFNMVILTSRPGMPYPTEFDRDWLELEIMGFDDESKNRYIEKFFFISLEDKKEAAKKIEELKKGLANHPLANSLAHIPINLCFICSLTLQGESLFIDEQSMTVSYFYHEVIKRFYKQALTRFFKDKNLINLQKDDNPRKRYPIIGQLAEVLEKVAWQAMDDNTLNVPERRLTSLEFSDWMDLGLINYESEEVCRFAHLTFQEYFAASALAQLYLKGSPEEAESRVKKIKFKLRYQMVLSMTAGILSLEYEKENEIGCEKEKYKTALESYFRHLYDDPRDSAQSYELQLFARCFEECIDPNAISHYPDFIEKASAYFEEAGWDELRYRLLNRNNKLLQDPKIEKMITNRLSKEEPCLATLKLLNRLVQHSSRLPSNIISSLLDIGIGGLTSKSRLYAIEVIHSLTWSRAAFNKEVQKTLIEIAKSQKGGDAARDVREAAIGVFVALAGTTFTFHEEIQEVLIALITDGERQWYNYRVREGAAQVLVKLAKSDAPLNQKVQKALIALIESEKNEDVSVAAAEMFVALIKSGVPPNEEAQKALIVLIESEGRDNLDVQDAGEEMFFETGSPNAQDSGAKVFVELAKSGAMLAPTVIDEALIKLIESIQGGLGGEAAGEAIVELAKSEATHNEKAQKAPVPLIINEEADWVTHYVQEVVEKVLAELTEFKENPNEGGEAGEVGLVKKSEEEWAPERARIAAQVLVNLAISGAALNKKLQKKLIALVRSEEERGAVDWFQEVGVGVLVELGKLGAESNQEVKKALIALISSKAKGEAADLTRKAAVDALTWFPVFESPLLDGAQKALIALISSEAKGEAADLTRTVAVDALTWFSVFEPSLLDEAQKALIALISSEAKGEAADLTRKAAVDALTWFPVFESPLLDGAQKALIALIGSEAKGEVAHQAREAALTVLLHLRRCFGAASSEEEQKALIALITSQEKESHVDQSREARVLLLYYASALHLNLNEQKSFIEYITSGETRKCPSWIQKGAGWALIELAKSGGPFSGEVQKSLLGLITSQERSKIADRARIIALQAFRALALESKITFDEKIQETLIALIENQESGEAADWVRMIAIEAFGSLARFRATIFNEKIQETLIALIENQKPGEAAHWVRLAAIEVFGRLAGSEAIILNKEIRKALITLIKRAEKTESADQTCAAVVQALSAFGMYKAIVFDQEIEEVLAALIKNKQEGEAADQIRECVARAFARFASASPGIAISQDGQEALIALISSKKGRESPVLIGTRKSAENAFVRFVESGVPLSENTQSALITFIERGDINANRGVVAAVFGALARFRNIVIRDEEVQRALITLLRSKKWGVFPALTAAKAFADFAESGIALIPEVQEALIESIRGEEEGDGVSWFPKDVAEVLRVIATNKNSRNREACHYSSLPFVSDQEKGKEKEENSLSIKTLPGLIFRRL